MIRKACVAFAYQENIQPISKEALVWHGNEMLPADAELK